MRAIGAAQARAARRRRARGGAAAQAAGGSACKLLQPLLPAQAQVDGAQLGRAAERERHGMSVRARKSGRACVCARYLACLQDTATHLHARSYGL